MKTLFLLRHAKSSWKDAELADVDRPLNKRGKRDAAEMARRLAARLDPPEVIVTSPAFRALATATVMAAGIGIAPSAIEVHGHLYDAGTDELMDAIRALSDDFSRVMLVGHNPGVTETVNLLAGASIENVPTCGVAVLGLDVRTWAEVRGESATLLEFDYPKRGPV
jgi:phosphohistidine phosphatase